MLNFIGINYFNFIKKARLFIIDLFFFQIVVYSIIVRIVDSTYIRATIGVWSCARPTRVHLRLHTHNPRVLVPTEPPRILASWIMNRAVKRLILMV